MGNTALLFQLLESDEQIPPNRWRYSPFSHFLTFDLVVQADRPLFLVIQYVRSCSICSRCFFMSSFMLSLQLFFGRPLLLLPESSSLMNFVQMWLCSRLKHWLNPFSQLLSSKVSTGFVCASFLAGSNVVFSVTHLNILISAEYGFLSSFFLRPNFQNRMLLLV